MAAHDFWCTVCGQVLVDVLIPATIGATAGAPDHCGRKTSWLPAVGAMDIGAVKTSGFRGFTTTDGRGQRVEVDSLHTLRRVEREAEQAHRNGEGQPMVFRHWAQDPSNRDQPTLSRSYYGGDAPTPQAKQRFGATRQTSSAEPESSFGPGVDESNTSALRVGGEE